MFGSKLSRNEGIFKCAVYLCGLSPDVGNVKGRQAWIHRVGCRLPHPSFAAAPSFSSGSGGKLRLPEPEH